MVEYVVDGVVLKENDPVYSPFGWPWNVYRHCCGGICVRAGPPYCHNCGGPYCKHLHNVGMKPNPRREWWQFWKPKQVDDMRGIHEYGGWVYTAQLSTASARELGVTLESLLGLAGM